MKILNLFLSLTLFWQTAFAAGPSEYIMRQDNNAPTPTPTPYTFYPPPKEFNYQPTPKEEATPAPRAWRVTDGVENTKAQQQPTVYGPVNKTPAPDTRTIEEIIKQQLGDETYQCFQEVPKEQRNLLTSLKDVSDNMDCAKAEETTLATTKVLSDNIKNCYCLSKIKSPISEDMKYAEELKLKMIAFAAEKYIWPLADVRIKEYSLSAILHKDVDPKDDPCFALNTDANIQKLRNGIEFPTPNSETFIHVQRIKNLLGALDKTSATDLYNIEASKKGSPFLDVPLIRDFDIEAAANYFAERDENGKKADKLIAQRIQAFKGGDTSNYSKEQVQEICSLNGQCSSAVNTAVNTVSSFVGPTPVLTPTKDPQEEQKDKLNYAYLDNMLTQNKTSSGVTYLDAVYAEMKMPSTATASTPKEKFILAYKNVIREDLRKQCDKSHKVLAEIAKDKMSTVLSDPEFLEKLAKSPSPNMTEKKIQCSFLQKELITNPLHFLETYCSYSYPGTLPPQSCLQLNSFLKSQFLNPSSQAAIAAAGTSAGQVGKYLGSTAISEGSSDLIAKSVSNVKITNTTTIQDATNQIRQKGYVDIASFDVIKNKNPSNFTNNEESKFKEYKAVEVKQTPVPSIFNNTQSVLNSNLSGDNNAIIPNVIATPSVVYERKIDPVITQSKAVSLAEESDGDYSEQKTKKKKSSRKKSSKKNSSLIAKENEEGDDDANLESEDDEVEQLDVGQEETITATKSVPQEKQNKKTAPVKVAATAAPQKMSTPAINIPSTSSIPTFSQAKSNPSLIPDEAVKSYAQAKKIDSEISSAVEKKSKQTFNDPQTPETGLMLTALKTGKIAGKDVAKITLGEEIKDIVALEKSQVFRGAVVLVEDKDKKERYICRAYVGKDLLPINAKDVQNSTFGGYKCVSETQSSAVNISSKEKEEVKKVLSNDERLYKTFVLNRILNSSKK